VSNDIAGDRRHALLQKIQFAQLRDGSITTLDKELSDSEVFLWCMLMSISTTYTSA